MVRSSLIVAFSIAALGAPSVLAQRAQFGTAVEAKAMEDRVVTELKAGETAALQNFNKPDGEFRDRDLYVFCFDTRTGLFTAQVNPLLMGTDNRLLKEKDGSPLGQKVYAAAQKLKDGGDHDGELQFSPAEQHRACSEGDLPHQGRQHLMRGGLLQVVRFQELRLELFPPHTRGYMKIGNALTGLLIAGTIGTCDATLIRADEVLKFREVLHAINVQSQEVGDVEGHLVSVFRFSGIASLADGSVGTASFVGANDYVKGSGSFGPLKQRHA